MRLCEGDSEGGGGSALPDLLLLALVGVEAGSFEMGGGRSDFVEIGVNTVAGDVVPK